VGVTEVTRSGGCACADGCCEPTITGAGCVWGGAKPGGGGGARPTARLGLVPIGAAGDAETGRTMPGGACVSGVEGIDSATPGLGGAASGVGTATSESD
jgi:hypothetical protein